MKSYHDSINESNTSNDDKSDDQCALNTANNFELCPSHCIDIYEEADCIQSDKFKAHQHTNDNKAESLIKVLFKSVIISFVVGCALLMASTVQSVIDQIMNANIQNSQSTDEQSNGSRMLLA